MALKMARILSDYAKGVEVAFVGHSLGGGLAALASLGTGRVAVTFNAASVSDAWVSELKNSESFYGEGRIWNYVTDGDWLTSFQEKSNASAKGSKILVPNIKNGEGHSIKNLMLNLKQCE